MSAVLGSLLKVDLSRVPARILEGLQSGKMMLSASNGNVYWASGSGGKGIVAQLPLVPVSPEEQVSAEQLLQLGQAMSGAKAAAVTATAVGAAVVVVVIVAATAYLAQKIDKVERSVEAIARTVEQQDRREYLKGLSDYTGSLRAAHELLHSRAAPDEIARQAVLRIDDLAVTRQQLLARARGLQNLVSHPEQTTQALYELTLQFLADMFDLIPTALVVERELCLAADMPGLARSRIVDAGPQFRAALAEFQQWCEQQYRHLAMGQGSFPDVLLGRRQALNALFNSSVHDLLLNGFDAAFSGGPLADADAAHVGAEVNEEQRASR